MNAASGVVEVVRGWVEKAENDLTTAAHTLRIAERCPTDTVCFHAQQCVEKYLKALLVLRQTPFPKIHSLAPLLALLPPSARPSLSDAERERLADYAVVARYPGDCEPISRAEARRAVAIARRVRREVRRLLPHPARRRARA
jgi:HEPN domain-containing protein